MNPGISWKLLLFWALFVGMLASFSLTIIFETHFLDELSIASGILTGIALFFTGMFMLIDTIISICNP
ncbi:hypothetical protein [Acinetobacter equi]|uniref:Uncharacterized protein n=1 Tax=Acinetobacter equi TaxID=1324350 RepID=A0A0N9VWR1_9GAMM|nr:hypothetical protein [Acinetobacter equi]ALH94500.1 hypothetical protein AOY20_02500 [Acinetobacter equi]